MPPIVSHEANEALVEIRVIRFRINRNMFL